MKSEHELSTKSLKDLEFDLETLQTNNFFVIKQDKTPSNH
jgi:hypothetical protein